MTATEIAVVCGVGFGAALLGALVGGLTTALLELWRQVLAGQAAARVIRFEIMTNRVMVGLALEGTSGRLDLLDGAWRQHRLALAPILSEIELSRLHRDLCWLPLAQAWLGPLYNEDTQKQKEAREQLEMWNDLLRTRAQELLQIEFRSRLRLFWQLLFGPRRPGGNELVGALIDDVTQLQPPPTTDTGRPSAEKPDMQGGEAAPSHDQD